MRGTPDRELPALRRDDLGTQDLDLLEDGLQWQSRVVHEEELTLVVTDHVSQAGVSVDDLLRASDGQRCSLAEILE